MKLATSVISIILLLVAAVFGDEPERIVLYKRDGIVVKLLRGDGYGYMFINDGVREGKSIPRYILAIEDSRTVIDTKDLKVFRAVLAALPKGIGISQYSTCGLPMAFGLNDEDSNRFIRTFQEFGIATPPETRITCKCGICSSKPGWPGNAVANNNAEQDGAGQPATRPESKSKGGDKPQPDAEGRSR